MGDKRLKLARGLGDFVPLSVNFSQLQMEFDESEEKKYEPSDDGLEQRRLEDSLEFEELVIQIMCNLEPREQLVFAFQLLRDGGFQIDHAAFAKVVKVSRRQYMRILEDVRLKTSLFIMGHNSRREQESQRQ